MISMIRRAGFASSTTFFAAHFLPVLTTGATSLTHLSHDSISVISNRTLVHLNSSVESYPAKASWNSRPFCHVTLTHPPPS
ncbi:UNVERIFIED_CONTAM: hypothetical protein FKN15_046342 [Acipenser sinensis]